MRRPFSFASCCSALLALSLVLLPPAAPAAADDPPAAGSPPQAATPPVAAAPAAPDLQAVIKRAKAKVFPALVHIQPVYEEYRGGSKVLGTATGSGVIISPEGFVLTNYHVAGRARKLICTLSSEARLSAELVGADPWTDIAVIRLHLKELKGEPLAWASLGNSDRVEEGDFVMAMGSPLALSFSVSFGVVSRRDRPLGQDMNIESFQKTGLFNTWIQTDAAINPGNSGGPLVNLDGEVVGINARANTSAEAIGFAIPVNIVRAVADQLIAKGKVTRSWIGVSWQPLEEFSEHFKAGSGRGVLVAGVVDASPAAAAGLRPGDVVVEFDGSPMNGRFKKDLPGIARRVADTPVGREVVVKFVRDDREQEARLKTEELERAAGEDFECKDWGLTVKEITRTMARELSLEDANGVLVTGAKAGGAASRVGLENGDVIRELSGAAVTDLDVFRHLAAKAPRGPKVRVLLRVLKGGRHPRLVLLPAGDAEPAPVAKETPAPAENAEKPDPVQ
ncbi:MAG: trypsin-like peptidase domain-containing protein [Planctomycetes bacterium]|nr:trypsin-like peptidase domain-containing protein [Planctomycetota bacterium]